MPILSDAEIYELVEATFANDGRTINKIMTLYQHRTPIEDLKNCHPIEIAAYIGLPDLVKYYLSTSQFEVPAILGCAAQTVGLASEITEDHFEVFDILLAHIRKLVSRGAPTLIAREDGSKSNVFDVFEQIKAMAHEQQKTLKDKHRLSAEFQKHQHNLKNLNQQLAYEHNKLQEIHMERLEKVSAVYDQALEEDIRVIGDIKKHLEEKQREMNRGGRNQVQEHSSDEERLSDSGSHSPGHSTDSDPESAGSNNSPPSSPPKLAKPSKPLSEKAQKLLTRKGTPDKALRHAFMSDAGADVINELCDLGLTFEEVDDDPKSNVFHFCVLICTKDASLILSKYPHCLNSVNSDGQTAAHLVALKKVDRSLPAHEIKAEEHDRIEKVKFLIEKGANIHTADKFGRFPLDYAWAAQMSDLAVFIEANRPKPATRPIQRQPQEITYTAQSSYKLPVSVSVQPANSRAALFSAPVQQPLPAASQRQVAPPAKEAKASSIGAFHVVPPPTTSNDQYQQHKKKSMFGSIKDLLPGNKKEASKPAKVAP